MIFYMKTRRHIPENNTLHNRPFSEPQIQREAEYFMASLLQLS
jgi:hypothetical protein